MKKDGEGKERGGGGRERQTDRQIEIKVNRELGTEKETGAD